MNFQENTASNTQPASLNSRNKGLVNVAVRQNAMRPLLGALMLAMLAGMPVAGFAVDTDGDGVTDSLDLDDDNDGILDTVEGCHTVYENGLTDYTLWSIPPTIESYSSANPPPIVYNPIRMLDGFTTPDITSASNHRDDGSFTIVDLGHIVPAGTQVKLVYQGSYGFNGSIALNKYNNDNNTHLDPIINEMIDVDPNNNPNNTIDGDIETIFASLAENTRYLRVLVTETGNDGRVDVDFLGVADHFVGGMDFDGDGVVNCIDLDSDGDGITDNVEAQTTAGYIPPGTFADTGVAPGSNTGDGINDVYGTGLTLENTDGDSPAYPDYLDTDSDDDGFPDIGENNLLLAVSGTDADGDGIDANHDSDDATRGSVNNGMDSPSTELPNSDSAGNVNYRDTNGGALACEPVGYMVKGQGSAWTTVDLVEGTVVNADDNFATQINGIGYNPTDNAIWGFDNDENGIGRDGQLTRTVKDGSGNWVTTLTDPIPGLPLDTAYPIGDVSDAGVMHLYSNGKIQKVDVNPASGNYLTRLGEVTLDYSGITGPFEPGTTWSFVIWDWAFHADFPNLLFAVGNEGTNNANWYTVPHLYQINATTGVVSGLGPAGVPSPNTTGNAGFYGASFMDADGFLNVSDNQDETPGADDAPIYRIDLRGVIPTDYDETKTVLFSVGPQSGGKNDGAMCRDSLINIDFGDAPDSYGTTLTANGPRHEMAGYNPSTGTNNMMLGSSVDREFDGIPSVNADGDNSDTVNDEDGVVFTVGGTSGARTIKATVQYTTSNIAGALWAWMAEVDGAGDPASTFVEGQRLGVGFNTQGSGGSHVFEWPVPQVDGETYIRFRICSEVMGSNSGVCDSPLGPALDGEVEDYKVSFNFSPTAVTIGDVALKGVAFSAFLDGIGAGQMDTAALLALLTAWDADLAPLYLNASREALLQALADYLDPDGDGVVALLRWDTLEQTGTIGFFVEREQSNGDWKRLNGHMLPAILAAPMGAEYWLADPSALPGESYSYRLIEQEATGTTNSYGPFNVEMPR